jgi:hypothetical protein
VIDPITVIGPCTGRRPERPGLSGACRGLARALTTLTMSHPRSLLRRLRDDREHGNDLGLLGLLGAAAVVLSALSTGCTHVAPYERGMLAHPTMTADDISSGMDEHVRAVSEGASGGLSGGGGGCGCN